MPRMDENSKKKFDQLHTFLKKSGAKTWEGNAWTIGSPFEIVIGGDTLALKEGEHLSFRKQKDPPTIYLQLRGEKLNSKFIEAPVTQVSKVISGKHGTLYL